MRKFYVTIFFCFAVGIFLGLYVQAAGTPAGTTISNQAYGDYKDANGNAMPRVYSNIVTTVVSQVAGANIIPATSSSTAKVSDKVYYLIQLFNTGNAKDTHTFSYTTAGDWTPSSVKFYYDANNNHTYDAATDILLSETSAGSKTYKPVNGIGVPVQLDPDDDCDIMMEVTVPPGALDNTQSLITVTTKSDFDNTKTAVGTYTTKVESAVINAQKTSSAAPGSRTSAPGDTITYTITLTNTGSSAGSTVVVSDPIPSSMTYKAGTILLNGVSKTDANDADEANFGITTVNAVTVNVVTIAAGASAILTFQVTVNSNSPAGTPLINQATVTYSSGGNPITEQTNATTFFVGDLPSVSISTTASPKTGNPGDKITYPFTVTNKGNLPDTVNLAATSSSGWTWAIWIDSNGDGIAGNGGDYLLTDTNGDGKIDTGSLPATGSIAILAVATIPSGIPNSTQETLTITASSAKDSTKTDSKSIKTTVISPQLTVTKTVSPTGSQPPGTILTYTVTVTNIADGDATSVIITDFVPANTTYVAGSMKTGNSTVGGPAVNLVSRTDASDGDGAYYDSNTKSIVIGGTSTSLGKNGILVLEFKVTIN